MFFGMLSQKLRPADSHGRHLILSIVARQRIGFDIIIFFQTLTTRQLITSYTLYYRTL